MVSVYHETIHPSNSVVSYFIPLSTGSSASDTDWTSQQRLEEIVLSDPSRRSDCSVVPMGHEMYRIGFWARLHERGSSV